MKLRNLFTDQEVLDSIEAATSEGNVSYARMAEGLSSLDRCDVTRQLARYWARQFEHTKKNGDFYLTMVRANRELKDRRNLRNPSPSDQLAQIDQPDDPTRILFFTDNHAPYHHPDLLDFLSFLKDAIKPTMVIHGGDEVDNHALSFHNADPNLDSPGTELEQARLFINDLHELFPVMRICESNHGSLHYRRAKAHGIPVQYLRTYREILFPNGGGEGWSWHSVIRIDGFEDSRPFQFQHQASGDLLKQAAHEGANLYVGHEHSKFGVGYGANAAETYHSVYGGCTMDADSMAFAYGKLFSNKPIIGAVTIINGVPTCVPMKLDRHGRWKGTL